MLGRGASGSEHAHSWTNRSECIETEREFGCDLADPRRVGCANTGRLVAQPQQQLLIEGRLVLGQARSVCGLRWAA
jgi:hypothetical protein